jgi:hypothetical protein
VSNNPLLHYKPGLTMDTPLTVTMAAADWAILISWFANRPSDNLDGVYHLVYGVITEQVSKGLYTQASLRGAEAHVYERQAQGHPLLQMLGMQPPVPTADDFASKAFWVVECAECSDRDEYEEDQARRGGPLTCGHDGGRMLREIVQRPIEEE